MNWLTCLVCGRFWAHFESCWALGVSCRWFISTRRRKCRSFLFSLLITTWRPLSRPPSLISRWVVMPWAGSKELLYEGVIHSRCLRPAETAGESANFPCHYAWRYFRIDLQMKCSAVMLPECHGQSLRCLLLCSSGVKSELEPFWRADQEIHWVLWLSSLSHHLHQHLTSPLLPLICRNYLCVCMVTVCR